MPRSSALLLSARYSFGEEIYPYVYSKSGKMPELEEFFTAIKEYRLSEQEAESSPFRYCGGDTNPSDIRYYRLIFPDTPLPEKQHACVCGHHIENNCYITNTDRTILAILGSCCIKRFWGTKSRHCENCDATHTNRLMNRCNACLKIYREEQKTKAKEEWREEIEEGQDILEEYSELSSRLGIRTIKAKKYRCSMCLECKNKKPFLFCSSCEKAKTDSFKSRRLRVMNMLWPLFVKQIEQMVEKKRLEEEEQERSRQERSRQRQEEENRIRYAEREAELERLSKLHFSQIEQIREQERIRLARYEIERKEREAEYIRQWQLAQKQKAKERYEKKKQQKKALLALVESSK